MADAVEAAFEPLPELRVADCWRRDLPPEATACIEKLIDIFASAEAQEKQPITQLVKREFSCVFDGYAYRAALSSVRHGNPALLRRGLLALAIENATDYRDTLHSLAFLYNSAIKLKVDVRQLFESVASIALPRFSGRLTDYLAWIEDVSVQSFGYQSVGEGISFSYVANEKKTRQRSRLESRIRSCMLRLRRLPIIGQL